MASVPQPKYLKFSSNVTEDYEGKAFSLAMPQWDFEDGDGRKLLIVLDRVPKQDIQAKRLLAGERSGVVWDNIFRFTLARAKKLPSSILVVNYEDTRYSREDEGSEHLHRALFRKRLNEIVSRYQPDQVMLMGPELTRDVFKKPLAKLAPMLHESGQQEHHVIGRFINVKYGKIRVPTLSTISLSTVSNEYRTRPDDFKSLPNLIGHILNHLDLLLHGKNRWTVKLANPKCIFVDTIKKFDIFMEKLWKAKRPAIDTETASLNRIQNTLLSIQFGFNGTRGYFIPLYHPQTPFSSDDIAYIKARLVEWFERGEPEYAIYQNARFDLLQIKNQLKTRFISHKIYDISAGEFILDENRMFRNKIDIPGFSLGQMSVEYGYFGYLKKGEMLKSERENVAAVDIKRLSVYGIKDVCVPWQIHEFQIKEAKRRGDAYKLFLEGVTETISDMIHSFVVMESNGLPTDRNFLLEMMSPSGEFQNLMRDNAKRIRESPAVIEANEILLDRMGTPTQTMFGNQSRGWVFDIAKRESQQVLFFEVLGLEALDERKDGGGKLDKFFQAEYADVPEVSMFTEWNKLQKLYQTFIVGFYKKLTEDPDMAFDNHMRPVFMYLSVITGRASAKKPSLQQVPSRTDEKKFPHLAKMVKNVKRQFAAESGQLFIKADFSAHEVRNWAIIALDNLLAEGFRKGVFTWREYRLIKEVTEEIRAEWDPKFKAVDIHRVNYEFFYGKEASTVDKEERQSIKAVVFGVIYGKGPESLSEDINDTPDAARKLIKLLFDKFKDGGAWIKEIQRIGKETCVVPLVNGRVRHLFGYLHWDRSVHGAMNRRGPNSAIQGPSSDQGFNGARNMQKVIWNMLEAQGQPFTMRHGNAVHDSSESVCGAVDIPLACYILEHSYTTLVHRKYRKVYGHPMNVNLAMEMDIGPTIANVKEWDFRVDSQLKLIEEGLRWANENMRRDVNISKVMKKVQHNAEIISNIRMAELRKEKKLGIMGGSEIMTLKPDNIFDYGLRFTMPREKAA